MNLYQVALTDNTTTLVNLDNIATVTEKEGFLSVAMAGGTVLDVIPHTFSLAIEHSKAGFFLLATPEEEEVKEVEGEVIPAAE